GNGLADNFQYAQPGGLGQRLLAATLLLLGFKCGIGLRVLPPFRVMHRAFGIGAYFAHFAFLAALGDDSLGHVLARLKLRRILLIFVFWLVLPDFNVLVAGNDRAAVLRGSVSCADLYQFGFGRDALLHECVQLGLIAFRVGAGIRVGFPDVREQQD